MSEGTRSEDYSGTYFNDAHLGGYDDYRWDNETWRSFFVSLADRVVGITNPRTVLDVGCARGLFVQALVARGVDATGIDVSEHAVESAHPDVRDRLRVASAAEPIEGHYDLVSCIEVLEHLSPVEAQAAIDAMTAVTARVLFSSSPADHDEATHVNTRPTAQWVAWFAERGFFRRTDVDLSFLSPWAVLLERDELTVHTLTQRYEQQLAALGTELAEKRRALLESHRRISGLAAQLDEGSQSAEVERWQAEVLDARHQLLTRRDHVIGLEAEVTRLTRDHHQARTELNRTKKQLANVRERIKQARTRVQRLERDRKRLAAEVEALRGRPSFARRVARKVLGGSR